MIRIGFTGIGGRKWVGGRNYLFNLLSVLSQYEAARVSPVLFLGEDADPAEWKGFQALPGVELVSASAFDERRATGSLAQALLTGRDAAARRLFQRHGVNLVFESARFFGWRIGIPVLAWIPDFQHRQLPQLFPAAARLKRELGFRMQILSGRELMLSSEDARRDCIAYYPAAAAHAHTVHFAIRPGTAMPLQRARALTRQLGLEQPFFFLPNQFWRHKNHGLVVDALAILRSRGRRLVVLASGQQSDPRAPEYFPQLRRRIAELGLADSFLLPGLIPYEQVQALMRTCSALINPSLFEGWSTTVEEARLIGTPVLLSDLDVHREQMGAEARYFDRHSPAALAECLDSFVPLDESGRETAFRKGQEEGATRARAFATRFADVAEVCAGNRRRSAADH